MKRTILLGTGTDVGKTYVGTQLASAWRQRIGPVLGLKPIESGLTDPKSGDAFDLGQAATMAPSPCYSFREGISPHLAARREGREIELPRVVEWIAEKEREFEASHDGLILSLIESAGGVYSPISDSETNFDLASCLKGAEILLIAPDALGVLHDVQATLRSLPPGFVSRVVLSESRSKDASTGLNASELEGLVFKQLREHAPRQKDVISVGRDGDVEQLLHAVSA